MVDNSLIPRAMSVTDAKRRAEEQARLAERKDSSRKAAQTTVSSGGTLDIDGGDLTVLNGGNAVVRDGGSFHVEGGGALDISGNGMVTAHGHGVSNFSGGPVEMTATLGTKEWFSDVTGQTYRYPVFSFATVEGAASEISAFSGNDPTLTSGMADITYGPYVGPNIQGRSTVSASPSSVQIESVASDKTIPDWTGRKGSGSILVSPDSLSLLVRNISAGTDIGSISVSVADPKLRLSAQNGVDVKGPFTVDGQPVSGGSGAVSSVAGKTGAVTLVKGDVGLGNVDNTTDTNKPVSTATQTALNGKAATTHTHAIGDVTGLQTALDDKTTKAYVDGADGALSGRIATLETPIPAITELAYNAPTFGAYNAAFTSPGYYKDRERVYLAGLIGITGTSIAVVSTNTYVLGTLPAGFRPAKDLLVKSLLGPALNQAIFMYVRASGQIQFYAPATATYAKSDFFISFENISFRI